ncbi:MAG: hypothetical protein V1913_00705 [Fibrobacterota bacterium]
MNKLFTQDDWARIERDWGLFWQGKLERPIVCIPLVDPNTAPVPEYRCFFPNYDTTLSGTEIMRIEIRQMARMRFIGDAFPKRFLNFGPGSMATYLGSKLETAEDTVWYHPLGRPLQEIQIKTDKKSYWYNRIHEILDAGLSLWGNNVQMSLSDIGGNLDILASLRGTEELLMDLCDDPDRVEALSRDITREWIKVYDAEAAKIQSTCRGTTPWAPVWSKEKSYMFQCDLSYMFSEEMFDRFAVPDLQTCCDHIPASFYHLDGKAALKHLDSLLAIKKLKGIQWIPGAGQPEPQEWPEVLSKIRKAGKFCQVIYLTPQGAKKLKKTMDLRGCIIQVNMPDGATPEEAERLYRELTV